MGCVKRKGPQCPESLSYQKKDGKKKKNFLKGKKKFKKKNLNSRCHTKGRMGVATRTQRLRTLGTFLHDGVHLE